MGLFQRTSLDESEKRLFDELWRRYQDNPNDFTETQGNVLTEINERINPVSSPGIMEAGPAELRNQLKSASVEDRKELLDQIGDEFDRRNKYKKGPSVKERFDELGYKRLKPEKKKPLAFLKNIFKKEQKPTEATTETTETTPKEIEEPKSTLTIEDAKYYYNRAVEDDYGNKLEVGTYTIYDP